MHHAYVWTLLSSIDSVCCRTVYRSTCRPLQNRQIQKENDKCSITDARTTATVRNCTRTTVSLAGTSIQVWIEMFYYKNCLHYCTFGVRQENLASVGANESRSAPMLGCLVAIRIALIHTLDAVGLMDDQLRNCGVCMTRLAYRSCI